MKQMVMDDDTPMLPEEIIRNILKRLSVKSLIRFQCVCKHWKNLIKTSSFIADHLHHTSHQYPSLLVPRSKGHPSELCLLDCDMQVREVPEVPSIESLDCTSALVPAKEDAGNSQVQANPSAKNEDRIPIQNASLQILKTPLLELPIHSKKSIRSGSLVVLHKQSYRRYVPLKTQELFERLVEIYTKQFNIHHHTFKHVLDYIELPTGVQSRTLAAARSYISCWFRGLYVSNRESVLKMSSATYTPHYSHYLSFSQERYDPFLQHLNTVIRPTHIHALEDAIWIPIIQSQPAWNTDNPFNINGWISDEATVQALIDVMNHENNLWRTVPLSHDNTTGGPMWLLDWHENEGYAWFPMEGHYSMKDLVAAYILGIPCTPSLGSRDVDDWTTFQNNTIPDNLTSCSVQRSTQRRFYGAAEYRAVTTREWIIPGPCMPQVLQQATTKKKRTEKKSIATQLTISPKPAAVEGEAFETSTNEDVEMAIVLRQYQVVDWCYHAKVIMELNQPKQNAALRSLLFSS